MNLVLNDFDYSLAEKLIANEPLEKRDESRLLVFERQRKTISEGLFGEIVEWLNPGDVLVLNQTKVIPARLRVKRQSGVETELLLEKNLDVYRWEAIVYGRVKPGSKLLMSDGNEVVVEEKENKTGVLVVRFGVSKQRLLEKLEKIGKTPLPPYIKKQWNEDKVRQKYQTVFAKEGGSVAAPTAGMHFTSELLEKLRQRGVELVWVTLDVGLGTFRRMYFDKVADNQLHTERYQISREAARRINTAKNEGRRIIAVGTTSARCLESAWNQGGIEAGKRETSIFIYPEHRFKVIDGLVTNFHLPKSSLLMMVSAFCVYPQMSGRFDGFGNSGLGRAYGYAIENNFRFYSFGDAMLIL